MVRVEGKKGEAGEGSVGLSDLDVASVERQEVEE